MASLAFLGFTGIFAFNTLLYLSLHYTTATNATLINSFIPVVSLFLGAIILREKIGAAQVAGSLLSIVGVVLILVQGSWQNLLQLRLNPGDLLMLLDTLAWAAYTVIGKKVMGRLSPLSATTYAVIFGLLLLYPAWFVEKTLPLGWRPGFGFSLPVLFGILYIGLFASVLAFLWWYEGTRAIGAGRASTFANLLPFYAALLAMVFLGERPAWFHLVGGSILVAGVLLASLSPGR
ncbi:MAG: DMT family transporter [Firmicutes bacterium]|nr:DMT family transporter [Bacillota bacterium]MCL5039882.1 DMT family transporter [Bacillota bacterium]